MTKGAENWRCLMCGDSPCVLFSKADFWVPQNLRWLLDYLARIAQPGADPKLICRHGSQLHVSALHLGKELARRSYKIKSVLKGRYYSAKVATKKSGAGP
jgi:hypothetical protein